MQVNENAELLNKNGGSVENNNTYTIGKSVYEVTRIFGEKESIKDILLAKITIENLQSFN